MQNFCLGTLVSSNGDTFFEFFEKTVVVFGSLCAYHLLQLLFRFGHNFSTYLRENQIYFHHFVCPKLKSINK